jgi:tRNA(fMet)-specific endonuclease VapC
MLDTKTASWLQGQPNVVACLEAAAPERICLSVVTEAEFLYGVARRPQTSKLRATIDELLAAIEVLSWSSATRGDTGQFGRRSNGAESRSARST